jgi:hypothetical protein
MYLLKITYPDGHVQTLTFTSAFSRSLLVIAMGQHPVTLTLEDPS